MDHRVPLGASTQRPRPPQRTVSSGGSSYGGLSHHHQLPKRPTLPSRLSNVRSASQPANVVDLTLVTSGCNREAFLGNREKLVWSPGVIDLDDGEDGEPPAKRAKTMRDGFRAEGDETVEHENDEAHEVASGSPLPSLPKAKSSVKRFAGARRHRFGIDAAARRAHGLDPPTLATRAPPPKKALDFSPWTGHHPEDTLNETAIKAGYFEKGQGTNQTESNSAKATVWPNLSAKNHAGLSMLSYLYTAVMEKRQTMGRCTAPSTFKPPPRVTVTDTKREAWLRDLANPEVPLRKQSRTIPHGIRGKLLMEQCLGKDIPLQRAVWLAKCVGANELRAFRRKGVSGPAAANGEAKWVREWTVHVEQFLEGVIALCGQLDWQQKMDYAVKLATAFYAEELLDADHFLDWIVSSFTEANLERLPIWIVLVQVYWKGITMYGRRGRRLAEGVLEHLQYVTETRLEVNKSLRTRLHKLITILAVTGRGCLIVPRTWEKHKHLLAPQADSAAGINMTETLAVNIANRNERLAAPLCKTAAKTRSTLLDLYIELDCIGTDVDVEKLATRCLVLVPDASKLVHAILDWASTPFRAGIARVYLAAALLANLRGTGYDIDAIVLQYIGNANALPTSGEENVHRVIVELVRLEAFSVGRYLQWLITSGVLSSGDGEPACSTSLIAALPTTGLPLHVLNTRKTLMIRLGFPVDEHEAIAKVLVGIDESVAISATESVGSTHASGNLTMSARFNISEQTCTKVSTMAKEDGISIRGFGVARDVIEHTKDVSSLAALVTAASTTDNGALLATVADMVNLHAESLAALGEFRRLIDGLTEQYLNLRSQQPPDRTFILALTGLTQRVPEKAAFVKLLKDDLVICEQQNALTAFSPASDSLIGMHATSLDSDDDVDAVFASGNTMDEQLMRRVFMRIMQRATKLRVPRPDEPVSRVSGWLSQLRSVDGSAVLDRLVQNYLQTLLKDTGNSAFAPQAIASLVSSGCVSLGAVADSAKAVKAPQAAAVMLRTFLITDTTACAGLSEGETYRYRLQQERYKAEHMNSLLTFVRTACDGADLLNDEPEVFEYLVWCVQVKPGSIRSIFEGGSYSHTLQANAGQLITTILQRGNAAMHQMKDLSLRSIVRCADPLSVRYSVEALQYFTSVKSATNQEDENMLGEAILESFSSCSDVWPQLLEFAPEAMNNALHEWAQDRLLSMAMDKTGAESDLQMMRYLDLLAITSTAANKGDNTGFVATITDKLKDWEKQLSDLDGFDTDTRDELTGSFRRLLVILHLCVEHVHASPDESEVSKQARCNLLAILCALLVHNRLQTRQDLVEYVFDLASTLSDNLPEASLATLNLPGSAKSSTDTRLMSILGSDGQAKETWLALASQSHLPGSSQQQRALNKHTSQQQAQMGGARPSISGPSQQSAQQQQTPRGWPLHAGPGSSVRQESRLPPVEMKMIPFPLRRWEIMPDPTPVMGENDASLSLGLFAARKV